MNSGFRNSVRRPFLLALVFSLAVIPALAAEDSPTDPLAAARTEFQAADSDEGRLAVAQTFLANHGDHAQAGMVLEIAANILMNDLNDADGAIALVESQLAKTSDAKLVATIQTVLIELLADPQYATKLEGLVNEMYAGQEMSFADHMGVIRAATGAESWSLVEEHAATAASQATPEAYANDYSDRGYSSEAITAAGHNRLGMLKTFTGWAAANQGKHRAALADFEAAFELVRRSYLGLPTNDLFRYWGMTLVKIDEADLGIKKLALAGVFSLDNEAMELAQKAYASLGRKENWDDYVWQLRREHGTQVADFSASDYQDVIQSFSAVRGKKATLLTFWFPT